MNEELVIRSHKEEELQQLADLWGYIYGREGTFERWKWRFSDCPFGKGVIMVALDGDKIVSAYSSNRMKMKAGDEIISAVHGLDGYTHPDYRKRGIYRMLVNQIMKDYMEEGVKFIYGFPNSNSYAARIRGGWAGHGLVDLWVKEVAAKDWSPPPGFEAVERFDHRSDELWSSAKNTIQVGIVRNKDYLNWRYVDNPSAEYHKAYLSRNGAVVGMVVLKTYSDGEEKIGHIVDSLAVDIDVFHELLEYYMGYFSSRNIKKLTCWLTEAHPFAKAIIDRGFVKRQMEWTHFTIKALSDMEIMKDMVENKDNWYMTMGDCDIF